MPDPRIMPIVLGEFATNCHVVSVPGAQRPGAAAPRCWIVDCGYAPATLIDAVIQAGLTPEAVVLTHAHCDHVAGLDRVLDRFPGLPVLAHEAERGFCSTPELNLSAFMGAPVSVSEPTRWLRGGETIELEGESFRVVHVPGHSPGGIALVHDASGQAIVGDTLFAGSMGRIDFPTSDGAAMAASLRALMALPDATRVFPGHGPSTTIGAERRGNPYVAQALRAAGGARSA